VEDRGGGMVERSIGRGFLSPVTGKKLHLDVTFIHMLLVLKLLHCMLLCCGIVKVVLLICSSLRREEGGHKPGTLRDFSEHGKLGEFCATVG